MRDPSIASATGQTLSCPSNPAPRVMVVDADRALVALIDEWLVAEGWVVVRDSDPGAGMGERLDIIIADMPSPRRCGVDLAASIGSRHPATPIIALSSAIFACVECRGPVARALGVACVLPKPVSREALTDAVRYLLSR